MRVLMTADAMGGVWTYALEVADALADHGVSVTLAVMGDPLTEAQREQAAASAVESVRQGRFALEWMDSADEDLAVAGHWLLELAAEIRPDVVHLNGYAHAGLSWEAPTLVVAHSDVLTWWAAVRGVAPPPTWDRYVERVATGLAAADAVVAPTAAYLAELRRGYGFAGGSVIPNGRGTRWVVDVPKESFVLGAGRVWDEAKNLALLDAAAGRIDWPVVLAGETRGPTGSIQPLRAAHAVGALPPHPLAVLLGRAAVFALPARYEPFGLGPLEAALSGCALVLGDIPTLREVWGDAATYVHPDDDEGTATVIDEILTDPDLASALGGRARHRAERYRPAAMGAAYADAYRRLGAAAVPAP
jgi:glycosyltransferase involved in cell wall biosynthesis